MIDAYVITLTELGTSVDHYDQFRASRFDGEHKTFALERAVAPAEWSQPGRPLMPSRIYTACSEDTIALVVQYEQNLGFTVWETDKDFSSFSRADYLPLIDSSGNMGAPPESWFEYYQMYCGSPYYANGLFYLPISDTYFVYYIVYPQQPAVYGMIFNRYVRLLSGASLATSPNTHTIDQEHLEVTQDTQPRILDVPNKKTVMWHRHGFCIDSDGGAHLVTSSAGQNMNGLVASGTINYPGNVYYHYSADGGSTWSPPVVLYTHGNPATLNPDLYLSARGNTVAVSLSSLEVPPMATFFSRIGSGSWVYLEREPVSGYLLMGGIIMEDDIMRIYEPSAYAVLESQDWMNVLPPTFSVSIMDELTWPTTPDIAVDPTLKIQRAVGRAHNYIDGAERQWHATLITNGVKEIIDSWRGPVSGSTGSGYLLSCCGGYHPPLASGYSFWW